MTPGYPRYWANPNTLTAVVVEPERGLYIAINGRKYIHPSAVDGWMELVPSAAQARSAKIEAVARDVVAEWSKPASEVDMAEVGFLLDDLVRVLEEGT